MSSRFAYTILLLALLALVAAALNLPRAYRGAALGDTDNDGDLDILMMDLDGQPVLLENRSPHPGNFLRVRAPIGSTVIVSAPAQTRQSRPSAAKPAPTKLSAEVQALYQKARDAEAKKNYAEAAAQYEQILKLDPTIHPLRANLGLMRYLNSKYDRAVREFRQALAGDASLQTAHLFLGLALLELNQPAEALSYLETTVRNKPQDLNARFQLARAYYLTDRHPQALKEPQFLIEKQPDDAETLFLLGRVHLLDQNKFDEALVHLKRSVELDPQSGEARASYGRCLLEMNQPQEAIAEFRQAVKLDATNAAAWFQLARAYQKTGDTTAAEQALQMYEKLKNKT